MDRTFADFYNDLEKLDLELVTMMAIENTEEDILRRQVEQLKKGLSSDGKPFRPYRVKNGPYARMKNELNPLPGLGNPDYILTGAFSSAIKVDVYNGQIGIHSYDEKAGALEAREGMGDEQTGADRIYGLDEQNHGDYVEEALAPELARLIETDIKLPLQ